MGSVLVEWDVDRTVMPLKLTGLDVRNLLGCCTCFELEKCPVGITVLPGAPEDEYERFSVTKMKYGGKAGAWDKTRIRYNAFVDIEGIPLDAQEYMLGSRSGLD